MWLTCVVSLKFSLGIFIIGYTDTGILLDLGIWAQISRIISTMNGNQSEIKLTSNGEIDMKAKKINVLLLENIHKNAVQLFEAESFHVEVLKGSLSIEKLKEKLRNENIQVLGIRSKTKLTKEIFEVATPKLIGIGCFCIGTDQVDLDAAREYGIPVFNSPFANTRSVAELVIAQIIMLARKTFEKSSKYEIII